MHSEANFGRSGAEALDESIEALVQRCIGEVDSIETPDTGYSGSVYKISAAGQITYLRLFKPSRYAAQVELHRITADAGVPMPQMISSGSDDETQKGFVVQSAVNGAPLSSFKEDTQLHRHLLVESGQILGKVHCLQLPGFGELQYTNNSLRGKCVTWEAYLESNKPDTAYLIDNNLITAEQERSFNNSYARLQSRQVDDGALLHNDFHPSHIFCERGQITGILDWDNEDITVFTVYRPKTDSLSGGNHHGVWGADDGSWDRFFASSTSNLQLAINAGVLSIDIADSTSSYSSVSSPSIPFTTQTFSFACGSTSGTFGSSTEIIYVQNPDAADDGWTVSIAASSTAAVWESAASSTVTFDYNDTSSSGCADGADSDSVAGRLTVNASAGSVATGTCAAGCSTGNISLGSSAAFSSTTSSITIVTASASSSDIGDWGITGVALTQTIPPEQDAFSDYSIDMILSIVAS